MILNGEIAIVTGSGRGIGRQVAIDLAAAGAAVGLVARSEPQLREVAECIEAAGGRAMVMPADVTDRDAIEAAVRRIEREFGTVTVAVNNAGVDRPFGPVDEVDPDDWWHTQAIHVFGPFVLMHAVIPGMRRLGKGRVINVISSASNIIGPNASSYCVAKATLLRLTEHVDLEIKPSGLSAFAVDPGTVMTSMGNAAIDDPTVRKWAKGLVDHLEKFRNVDPMPSLRHLGQLFVALASGRYDELSGRYVNSEIDLDRQLADARNGQVLRQPLIRSKT
jgi:NAD(P)-dependent dehydrogenase (short-subunit alcohol dehydrogenase family)